MSSLDTKALESLVKGSGLSYRENSVSWIFQCPRCSKRDKLYLRKRDGRFVCWKCASTERFSGAPEYALRELLGVPLGEIKEKLYGVFGTEAGGGYASLKLRDFFGEDDEVPYDLPFSPVAWPCDFYPLDDPYAAKGRRYLEGRGVSLELAQKYGLRYCPMEQRVAFPIVVRGQLVGWQARHIRPEWTDENGREWKVPKILTGPKTFEDRARCLMFQDQLEGAEEAILCEGPVDGLKCHMCGPFVVSMGKTVSQGQLDVLKASSIKRLYLGIDPDAAEEKTRLCREFSHLEVYDLTPAPGFGDLGAMSADAVLQRFQAARRISAGFIFLPPPVDFFTFARTAAAQRPE